MREYFYPDKFYFMKLNATVGMILLSIVAIMNLKKILLVLMIFVSIATRAQKIESIHLNLYTDSLKKGTFNYINVDGLLSNGKYMPLDSTEITFWASEGKFTGNSLWINKDFDKEKVLIRVTAKKDQKLSKEITMYVKKKIDDEKLKTSEELLRQMNTKSKRSIKKS